MIPEPVGKMVKKPAFPPSNQGHSLPVPCIRLSYREVACQETVKFVNDATPDVARVGFFSQFGCVK